jgi:hypothetical protein
VSRACWLVSGIALAIACGSEDTKKKRPIDYPGSEAGAGGAGRGNDAAGSGNEGGEGARAASGGDAGAGGAGAGGAGASGATGGTNASGAAGAQGGGDGVAGAGETQAGAAGAGGTGTTEPPIQGLYVAVDGSDAATGALDDPFLTLAHAASVAQAGDTIVLLDGKHVVSVASNAFISLAGGVNVMALNAGQATISAQGTTNLLQLSGAHEISGLIFENFQNVVRFATTAVDAQLSIEQTSFKGCGNACIEASGAARVQIDAAADAVLANGNGRFVVASGESQVRIDGGVLRNFGRNIASADAAVEALDSAVVELTGLRVEGGVAQAFSARGQATFSAKNVVAKTLGRSVMWLGESPDVSFIDSDLSLDPSV